MLLHGNVFLLDSDVDREVGQAIPVPGQHRDTVTMDDTPQEQGKDVCLHLAGGIQKR